jgi:hypothetical protein
VDPAVGSPSPSDVVDPAVGSPSPSDVADPAVGTPSPSDVADPATPAAPGAPVFPVGAGQAEAGGSAGGAGAAEVAADDPPVPPGPPARVAPVSEPGAARTGFDPAPWAGHLAPGPAEPADEPVAQPVTLADSALVARLHTEVQVVDGRPRYHLIDCPHLFGKEYEPMPVSEALGLGFTPCGSCCPDTLLLAEAGAAGHW